MWRVLLNFTVNKFAPGTRPRSASAKFFKLLSSQTQCSLLQICISKTLLTRQEFDWLNIKNLFFFGDLACHGRGATQKQSPSLGKDEGEGGGGGGGGPSLRRLPDLRTSYGGEQEWRTAPWTRPSGLGWSRFQLRSGGKITRRFQYAGESEQWGARPTLQEFKKINKIK